jgi:membrane protein implicated in regulation of membrane protease activity
MNFMNEALVTQRIAPGKTGRVKYRATWWPARCLQGITLEPGTLVYVVDRENITLYVTYV